jgi:hypothetical protein
VPVLLLAQGDKEAKDLLRRTIEARYGLRPPAIESLRLDFKGRVRARLGPIVTWVPVEATAFFQFPIAMRWDFAVKAVGVSIASGVEAFDGAAYRSTRGSKSPTVITDENLLHSLQRRLWAIAAVLLTPLGDHFVKLTANGDATLQAANTQTDGVVALHLRDDYTLDWVEVNCLNPDNNKSQNFILRMSADQGSVNDLMLPCKISAFWDDDPYFEVEPVGAETNPQIAEGVFTLES